jgi:CRP-like cAMP-binding protein
MQAINARRLRRTEALESRTLPDGTRLLKQTALGQYMALDPTRQRILDLFDGVKPVQEVLHGLLKEGGHPGIRAFYDLVLAALEKGFLVNTGMEPAAKTVSGHCWRIRWGAASAICLALAMICAGAAALSSFEVRLLHGGRDLLLALLFFSLSQSLACLLAGCTLSGFGRVVYRPGLRLDRIVPYFGVDLRDAFMGGRWCEICTALQALAAPFMAALAAWVWESPAGMLGCLVSALVLGSPFGDTPAHALLHALFRKSYELPKCADTFLKTRMLGQIFNWKEEMPEERYFLVHSAYSICWLGLVLRLASGLFTAQGAAVVRGLLSPTMETRPDWTSLAWLLILLAGILTPLIYFGSMLARGAWRALAPRLFRAESGLVRPGADATRPPQPEITRFLASTLLFSQLPGDILEKVASAMKFVVLKPGTVVVRERDLGDNLFVILEGDVAVTRETDAGGNVDVAMLKRGDVFGEIALLDQVPRTSTVRTVTGVRLLILGRADFNQLLVTSLGAGKIKETVQVCAFLQRHSLFSDWHPQALTALAHQFEFQPFKAGDIVIRENQPNDAFYLVYEGRFGVNKAGRNCATLSPGDFCGEISLLRETAATAEVVATNAGRCLRIGKDAFLKFVSENFLTGLVLENTVENRLKSAKVS